MSRPFWLQFLQVSWFLQTSTPQVTTTIMELLLPLLLLSSSSLVAGYTWTFKENPRQCSNLTINVEGDGGKPPYRVLIIPSGPTPLPNNIEARRIIDMPFPGNERQISFLLPYPENSLFVAVVSTFCLSYFTISSVFLWNASLPPFLCYFIGYCWIFGGCASNINNGPWSWLGLHTNYPSLSNYGIYSMHSTAKPHFLLEDHLW